MVVGCEGFTVVEFVVYGVVGFMCVCRGGVYGKRRYDGGYV